MTFALYYDKITSQHQKEADIMLEEMSAFFERRLDGYDEHMLNNIEGAKEFYPFTASCLPKEQYAGVLDQVSRGYP